MGCRKTAGLRKRGQIWHIEKQICGKSVCESTGTSDLQEAQLILSMKIEEMRRAQIFGERVNRTFKEAAAYFLETNMHLSNITQHAIHIKHLDPFIGDLAIDKIHMSTLQKFIQSRREEGMKTKTINLSLATVRRILNLAARLWRDNNGLSWLETSPLIQMLPENDKRPPYPLS